MNIDAVQEKSLGQKFVVDATLYTCLQKAGKSDDLRDTIDYAQIYRYFMLYTILLPGGWLKNVEYCGVGRYRVL